jgi:hypothetical protein
MSDNPFEWDDVWGFVNLPDDDELLSTPAPALEAEEWDAAGQQVTCKRCHRTYVCTASDDYYGMGEHRASGPDDGYCFACLLAENNIDADKTPVIAIDTEGRILDPREERG